MHRASLPPAATNATIGNPTATRSPAQKLCRSIISFSNSFPRLSAGTVRALDRTHACLPFLTLVAWQLTRTNPGPMAAFLVTSRLSLACVPSRVVPSCTEDLTPCGDACQVVEEQARGALHLHLVLYMHGSHRCTCAPCPVTCGWCLPSCPVTSPAACRRRNADHIGTGHRAASELHRQGHLQPLGTERRRGVSCRPRDTRSTPQHGRVERSPASSAPARLRPGCLSV